MQNRMDIIIFFLILKIVERWNFVFLSQCRIIEFSKMNLQLKEYRSLCISVTSVIEFFFGGSKSF